MLSQTFAAANRCWRNPATTYHAATLPVWNYSLTLNTTFERLTSIQRRSVLFTYHDMVEDVALPKLNNIKSFCQRSSPLSCSSLEIICHVVTFPLFLVTRPDPAKIVHPMTHFCGLLQHTLLQLCMNCYCYYSGCCCYSWTEYGAKYQTSLRCRWQTRATRCLTPTVFYTDVDDQCDKLVTDDRHQFITLTVYLSSQHLRRSTWQPYLQPFHQNLNSSHDLTTPLSGTVCHL